MPDNPERKYYETCFIYAREDFPDLELHLIRGNHDKSSGDPWPELKIACHNEPWSLPKWDCRHHPLENFKVPYFAGHVHPGYSLKGKGGLRERTACFQISKKSNCTASIWLFHGSQKYSSSKR